MKILKTPFEVCGGITLLIVALVGVYATSFYMNKPGLFPWWSMPCNMVASAMAMTYSIFMMLETDGLRIKRKAWKIIASVGVIISVGAPLAIHYFGLRWMTTQQTDFWSLAALGIFMMIGFLAIRGRLGADDAISRSASHP